MIDLDPSKGCMLFMDIGENHKNRCSVEFIVNDFASKLTRENSVSRRVTFADLGVKEEKPEHGTGSSGALWNLIVELPVGENLGDIGTAKFAVLLSLESGYMLKVKTSCTLNIRNLNGIRIGAGFAEDLLISRGQRMKWLHSYEKFTSDPLFIDDSLRFYVDIHIFTIITESPVPKMCTPSDLWLHSSSAMFNSPKFSDFKLQSSDGKVFHVQKLILKFRSDVFAAMFDHKLKETKTGECVVADVDGETLEALLKFLYGLNEWKPQLAEKLIVAADKYQILDLVDGCMRELISQLNGKNVARMLKLADRITVPELKQAALKFIVGDWDGFNKSGGFIELAENVGLLEELKDFSIQPPKSKKRKTTA